MPSSAPLLLGFALASVPLFVVGLQVRRLGKVAILSFVNARRVRDHLDLRRLAGWRCYLLGMLTLLVGGGAALSSAQSSVLIIAYVVVAVALVLLLVLAT